MSGDRIPNVFRILISESCIEGSDIMKTSDGFFLVYKSLSNILFEKAIIDFTDCEGKKLACDRFFDDWYLYCVANKDDCTYGLLKLREQEHDLKEDIPGDGDVPGITISFISFDYERLLNCIAVPSNENRQKLNIEINRVVAYKRQKHNKNLKNYFKNPATEGSYLVADLYTKYIAAMAQDGFLSVPECYSKIASRFALNKKSSKLARLPLFIESLNEKAGYVVCDNEKIFIKNCNDPDEYECAVILATHTGNTSVYSFAAEVEFHARFLFSLAKIKIPFVGKSVYESAIRADMTIGDTEFEGPAPFYKTNSKIVKRQVSLHKEIK